MNSEFVDNTKYIETHKIDAPGVQTKKFEFII
jgi:hypothetical protein